MDMDVAEVADDSGEIPVLPRLSKSYPITETELEMLLWLPICGRRRLIRRIKAETQHYEDVIA